MKMVQKLYYWSGSYEGLVVMAESIPEARKKARAYCDKMRINTIDVTERPSRLKDGLYHWSE